MNTRVSAMLLGCVLAMGAACHNYDFEKRFFEQSLADRVERSRRLTLEQQYKVFRYGNDVIHPPLMDLADPIAERGEAAVPFLLQQLESDRDDTTTRDIVLIFNRMARLRTYDVKSDEAVMNVLESRVAAMRDRDWQAVVHKMLLAIRDS